MPESDNMELPLQKRFQYEAMRRSVQEAEDAKALKTQALKLIDYMEAQQVTVMKMLQTQWLRD